MRLSVSSFNGVVLKPECAILVLVLLLLYFIRPEEDEYIVVLVVLLLLLLLALMLFCGVGVLVGVLSGVLLLWNGCCLEDRTPIVVDFDDFGVVDS